MATIKANPQFNVENACKDLNHAMKGFGTNEKKLIEVLTSVNNAQRQEIKQKYKSMYGKDLKDHIRSEVEGEFQEGLVDLLYTPAEFDARTIHRGLGFIFDKPSYLIEILASRSDEQLRQLENAYREKYGKELDEELKSEVHFALGEVLRSLASAKRPEDSKVDNFQAAEDAKALYDAGEGHFGTNESEFVRVLCSRSFAQLRKTFDEYANIAGKDIADSIRGETAGHFENALLAIVDCVRSPARYFAKQLHDDFEGIGTKDRSVARVIISRSEVDLITIKHEYNELFNQTLYERLKHETSGHFEDLLGAIVKN